MGLVLVTPPAVEPVSLDEAKHQARVYHPADDEDLALYVQAAREWLEDYTRRAFISQVWDWTMRAFPSDGSPLQLPKPPTISVDSVSYVDPDGATQSWAAGVDGWLAALSDFPATLEPGPDVGAYPGTQDRPEAVTIRLTCGYGTSGDSCPARARQVVRLLTAHQHRFRTPVEAGAWAEIPLGIRSMAYPLRKLLL